MGKKSLMESIKEIVEDESNTLKPGSKFKETMNKIPGEVHDAGEGPTEIGDKSIDPLKGTKGKDKSKSSVSQVGSEPMHKISEEEEVDEETVEVNEDDVITEEDLTAFVNEMIEANATEEEIQEALDEILEGYELVEEEVNESEEEEVAIEKPEINFDDLDLSEDMEALFADQDLSEEFKSKAKLIFETVIKSRVTEYQEKLDEYFEASLVEAVNDIEKSLTEDVEKFVNYAVNEWVDDNQVAIEAGLRTELTEDFITGFRNLCLEHYIDIPEEKMDLVEELTDKVKELEGRLNEEIENNVELSQLISESAKEIVLGNLLEGLTDTQAAKIVELSEGINFTTEEEFTEQVNTLKESYFPSDTKVKVGRLDETTEVTNENNDKPVPVGMEKYVDAIKRSSNR